MLACVVVALSIPQLYTQLLLETQHSDSQGECSNDTLTISTLIPQRRNNRTIEDAVEAAVMGGFLADAASLGLQGSVCIPPGLMNSPYLSCCLMGTSTSTETFMTSERHITCCTGDTNRPCAGCMMETR